MARALHIVLFGFFALSCLIVLVPVCILWDWVHEMPLRRATVCTLSDWCDMCRQCWPRRSK